MVVVVVVVVVHSPHHNGNKAYNKARGANDLEELRQASSNETSGEEVDTKDEDKAAAKRSGAKAPGGLP